jgi:LysR family transcriptional activator of nhaA
VEWLNYHHLLYFWTVAKEGSVAAACKKLGLSQPAVSGQLKTLEGSLGEKLFVRAGRGLTLTDVGKTAYRYADEIFGLGRELMETLKGRPTGRPPKLRVGVSDVVPKLIAYRLLRPVLELSEPVRMICHEDRTERLLSALALYDLDLVLTDAPVPPSLKFKTYNHRLGECGGVVMGIPSLAHPYRKGFPRSLDGAPFLLPLEGTALRRSLDQWFESLRIAPRIAGEFEDSALLKAFGQQGSGLFAVPDVISRQIAADSGVVTLGRIDSLREEYYAISAERRLQHPAVLAVANAARTKLFG